VTQEGQEPQERQQEPEQGQEQAKPEVADETRLQRGLRYGHFTGLYFAAVIAIAVLVFLILLIARNTDQVKFDYVFSSARTALIWLIVISAIAGWVLGIVTAFLIRRRTRWRRVT
jgi:uncharacterized integral membrane protein